MDDKIEIFTDGGCHGNPGPGAWAFRAVLGNGNILAEGSGYTARTTNNRMELLAVIRGLLAVSKELPSAELCVVTDSSYVRNGITSWIRNWKRNGWVTANRKPVKNQDLWQELDNINEELKPKWSWIRGHSGHEHNEACDLLVQKTINSDRP